MHSKKQLALRRKRGESFRVFLSYATANLAVVKQVEAALKATGADIFIAHYTVQPGEHLDSRIRDAIVDCDLFVLLWSSDASNSEWVRHEVGTAGGAGKLIVPLILDVGAKLPPFLSSIKYIEAFSDAGRALEQLASIVSQRREDKRQSVVQAEREGLMLLGIGVALFALLSNSTDGR